MSGEHEKSRPWEGGNSNGSSNGLIDSISNYWAFRKAARSQLDLVVSDDDRIFAVPSCFEIRNGTRIRHTYMQALLTNTNPGIARSWAMGDLTDAQLPIIAAWVSTVAIQRRGRP